MKRRQRHNAQGVTQSHIFSERPSCHTTDRTRHVAKRAAPLMAGVTRAAAVVVAARDWLIYTTTDGGRTSAAAAAAEAHVTVKIQKPSSLIINWMLQYI